MRRYCTRPDCDRPVHGHGLCRTHYRHARRAHELDIRYTDPLAQMLERIQPLGAWAAQAACRHGDPDSWFPEIGSPAAEAKRVCREQCPVRVECLEHALTNDERFGVWGGMSVRERDLLTGRRRRGAA